MAFVIKDRVKEGTTTTGTGDISLGGASATFDTFASHMTDGDTTYYVIAHTASGVDEWEVGLGTWNTGNTITRTTIVDGSSGTSAVDFSAGTKSVFMTYSATMAAYTDGSGDLSSAIGLGNHTTTDVAEGSNLYFNTGRIDSHLSGGTGVTYNAGAISVGQAVATTSNVTFNTVTLSGNPGTALQAATKEYVDTIAAAGIHYHERVRVEAAANRVATYDNGTSGVGATLTNSGTQEVLVIDGVTVNVADRVLITQQTNAAHNGVYTVTNVGSASTNWVLTRATDADSYGASDKDALGEGDAYFVKEGLTGAGELYVMNTSGVITFGTTPITFTVIAETAIYTAGTGLTLTGTEFATVQDIATGASPTFVTVNANLLGNVTGNVTGNVSGSSGSTTGNAATATKLATARTVQLSGDVTGSASFDGSANINITATVGDDSHAHIISNVDGLQAALDAKADDSTTITAGTGLTGGGTLGVNTTLSLNTTYSDGRYVQHNASPTFGSITVTGTVDGRDIAVDGTKLDSIENGATADQTITAGAGLTGGGIGDITISHADTSTVANLTSDNSGNTFIQDVVFGFDTYGHVTSASVATGTVSVGDGAMTVTAGAGLTGGGQVGTANQSGASSVTVSHAATSSQASLTALTGANVVSDIDLDTYGHVTALATRAMTLGDLGYTGATNANYITNNNELTNGAGYITSSGSISGNAATATLATNATNATTAATTSGNAGSATVLQTARNINGVSFNGSADITVADSTKMPTSGGTFTGAVTFNGNNITVGNSTDSTIYMVDTDHGNRQIHCNSNQIGFLTQANSWGSYCNDDGSWTSVGNVTAYSDVRLKSNIQTIESGLDKVCAMRGVTFEKDGVAGLGVIAQEVEAIIPEVVMTHNDGIKSVAYGNIVGVLIEAIKELKLEVESLKEKL